MKTIQYISRISILLIVGSIVSSCVKEEVVTPYSGISPRRNAVAINFKDPKPSLADLKYSLYLFSHAKGSSDTYIMEELKNPLQNDSRLKFRNSELREKDYRFLFVATPGTTPEIQVYKNTLNNPPATGDNWEDIRIGILSPKLSLHNYYQVKDISGDELLTNDSVRGELSRMVGQMEFRFFKIGNDITNPIPIDLTGIYSIFDRIYKIDITYTGYTTSLSFGEGNTLQPETSNNEEFKQEINVALNDRFGIEIPNGQLDTLAGGATAGGKFKGYCFLPANNNVRAVLKMYYYDTTPTCDNLIVPHTANCYEQRQLELRIPAEATAGLPIEANTYTVNSAGIRCNRIIDIHVDHNTNIFTQWDMIY